MPADWMPRLSAAIAATVREFASELRDTPVALLAVDCHPWNGLVELSVLTAAEAAADGLLADPAEMAAWRHYAFSADLASWRPATPLGRSMQAAYEAASDRRAAAEAFLRACAEAVARPEAVAAMESLQRRGDFRIIVAHPDDGREFFPPMDPAEASRSDPADPPAAGR